MSKQHSGLDHTKPVQQSLTLIYALFLAGRLNLDLIEYPRLSQGN